MLTALKDISEKKLLEAEVELRFKSDTVGMATIDTPLPPVFYVIVGAGPAAVINHSTLVRSEFGVKRLTESPAGKLPIIHIGFPNPWARYMQHGMGQPPHLLSLPAFTSGNQPHASTSVVDGGLDSKVFAGAVDRQFEFLRSRQESLFAETNTARMKELKWPWLDGWVAAVQTRAKEPLPGVLTAEFEHAEVLGKIQTALATNYPNFLNTAIAPYRVLTIRRESDEWIADFIYAQFLDLCTGTGRARAIVNPDNERARTPPWFHPSTWITKFGQRRILSAMDAICDDVAWADTERICVTKGGGIGLNAAEKAMKSGSFLDFFDDKSMVAQTFTNPRNYTFIKHWSEDRKRENGENQGAQEAMADGEILPFYPKGRIGQFAELGAVALHADRVEVTLAAKGGTAIIRASNRATAGLAGGCWESTGAGPGPSKDYSRLALAQGLDPNGVGQPNWYGKQFTPDIPIVVDKNGRMAALGTADKVIRILGAAAQVYTGFALGPTFKPNESLTLPRDKMWNFRATLPVSAVPDGFILAGLNIAKANEYFTDSKKNRNVNTMNLDEIETALTEAGVVLTKVKALTDLLLERRNPANGYSSLDQMLAVIKAPFRARQELVVKELVAERRQGVEEEFERQGKKLEEVALLKQPEPVSPETVPSDPMVILEEQKRLLQIEKEKALLEAERSGKEDAKLKPGYVELQIPIDLLATNNTALGAAFLYAYAAED